METVITASLIIFIILFASLTLYQGFMTSQETMIDSWQAMENRLETQSQTRLSASDMSVSGAGANIEVLLRNEGAVKLADYARWDVIVRYYDDSGLYHIAWLPYELGVPLSNEWAVGVLSQDGQPEAFEQQIFNPGETLQLQIAVAPAIGAGQPVSVVVVTEMGKAAASMTVRNEPPLLTTHNGLTANAGMPTPILKSVLQVTDADTPAHQLIYTVTTAPAHGTLTPALTFTQADIDNGLVSYSGTASDNFEFTVSDGIDSIGTYSFSISINAAPILSVNLPLVLTNSSEISAALLSVTDADNAPAELVYTVIAAPSNGTLSLGGSFTQQQINDHLLTYTGAGIDSFQFSVSDGSNTIGIYTFSIVP